jgi:hypothetical protein
VFKHHFSTIWEYLVGHRGCIPEYLVGRESGYLKIFFTFLEVNISNILWSMCICKRTFFLFVEFLILWISLPTKIGTPRIKVISQYLKRQQKSYKFFLFNIYIFLHKPLRLRTMSHTIYVAKFEQTIIHQHVHLQQESQSHASAHVLMRLYPIDKSFVCLRYVSQL